MWFWAYFGVGREECLVKKRYRWFEKREMGRGGFKIRRFGVSNWAAVEGFGVMVGCGAAGIGFRGQLI